ncbi:hypothetical protein [Mammaliicoccus sciuri]|uniref:hypothetical protein n=1 Tax=Mammaliicoccus sciuri TaxID=1296 RepID=UPI001FB216BD|nr:hypothetical protein [Mammaliicoccus sciuri]MCJ1764582.1 hypothetical protein [Mammaliicoccus sciuri]MCJ1773462.1 hypothetical protein [Mammaliicoccus sciuri]
MESVSVPIRNIVELVVTTRKSKDYIANIKSQFALSFEEIYILVYIYKGKKIVTTLKISLNNLNLSHIIFQKPCKT